MSACGSSSSSNDSNADGSNSGIESGDTDESTSNTPGSDTSGYNGGTAKVTIDGTSYDFTVECAFGAATANEEVSVSVSGISADGTALDFTEQWGFNPTDMSRGPDNPPYQTVTIYNGKNYDVIYEYNTLNDPPLTVSGKNISGTAAFVQPTEEFDPNPPTFAGDIQIACS
jgi:hypothetical protein